MKKVYLLLSFFLSINTQSYCQTIRIREDSVQYQKHLNPKWGRNYSNMVIPIIQFNWASFPQNKGAEIIPGQSFNFRLGAAYKRKINQWFSLGAQIQYSNENFYLQQDSLKIVPDTILNQSEWFNLQNIVTGFYLRFNFDVKRGNRYGIFLETGINHVLIAGTFHSRKNKLPSGETEHIKLSGLNYFQMNYGEVFGKIGWQNVSFVCTLRFTPVFKKSSGFPDLPSVKMGFELAY